MPSPPSSPDPVGAIVDQEDSPYSERFTDQLMRAVLDPVSPKGTVVLDKGSSAITNSDVVRLEDAALPDVSPLDVPLPLEDPRRVYRSAIPGVLLTHPGGPVEGGAPLNLAGSTVDSSGPPAPEVRELAQRLIKSNSIKSAAQLKKTIASETQKHLDDLRTQMQDRNEAIAENERLGKEIKQIEAERATERKIEKNWKLRRQAAERTNS